MYMMAGIAPNKQKCLIFSAVLRSKDFLVGNERIFASWVDDLHAFLLNDYSCSSSCACCDQIYLTNSLPWYFKPFPSSTAILVYHKLNLPQIFLWELKEHLDILLFPPDVETRARLMKNFVATTISSVLMQRVFPWQWRFLPSLLMVHIQSCVYQKHGSRF